jgi:hypothetical protein
MTEVRVIILKKARCEDYLRYAGYRCDNESSCKGYHIQYNNWEAGKGRYKGKWIVKGKSSSLNSYIGKDRF